MVRFWVCLCMLSEYIGLATCVLCVLLFVSIFFGEYIVASFWFLMLINFCRCQLLLVGRVSRCRGSFFLLLTHIQVLFWAYDLCFVCFVAQIYFFHMYINANLRSCAQAQCCRPSISPVCTSSRPALLIICSHQVISMIYAGLGACGVCLLPVLIFFRSNICGHDV